MFVPQTAPVPHTTFVPHIAPVPQTAPVPQATLLPQTAPVPVITFTIFFEASKLAVGDVAGRVAVSMLPNAAGTFRYPAPIVNISFSLTYWIPVAGSTDV